MQLTLNCILLAFWAVGKWTAPLSFNKTEIQLSVISIRCKNTDPRHNFFSYFIILLLFFEKNNKASIRLGNALDFSNISLIFSS